jgi:hypothetical protein
MAGDDRNNPTNDALLRVAEQQRKMAEVAEGPLAKWAEQQRKMAEVAEGPLAKWAEQQRKMAEVAEGPLAKWAEQQRKMAESGLFATLSAQQRKLEATLPKLSQQPRTPLDVADLVDGLWRRIRTWIDERWADFETEHPQHPHPVLYLVAALPRALGMPIYEAVKFEDDHALLLEALEPVFTDVEFVAEIKAAIAAAPLTDIAKEHLETGFEWLAAGEYVRAYPPFYNGLESSLMTAARARGLIDGTNRFVGERRRRAKKVDDLFGSLIEDPRYRRYLRAWIFGDSGNPYMHGDVVDRDACRRQSLRLAAAVLGWLQLFAAWEPDDFQVKMELQVERLLSDASGSRAA